MSGQIQTQPIENTPEDQPSKPYHQQPGEPDKWFGRFQHFCHLGPNRSLITAYRQVISSHARTVSKAWRQNADHFHWRSRADAWDADQRQRSLQRLESTSTWSAKPPTKPSSFRSI